MSKLSYATEIPFKKNTLTEHWEVSHFRDSWYMFGMCTSELFSYSFWTLWTYKLFFPTPGILPQMGSSIIPVETPTMGICQCRSGHKLCRNVLLPVLPLGASSQPLQLALWPLLLPSWAFAESTASSLLDPPPLHSADSTQTSRSRQMLPLLGSHPCFLYPQHPWCLFLNHSLGGLPTAIMHIIVSHCY